jgi:LysR family hydrogen peroxide-inducible transcriptional activator
MELHQLRYFVAVARVGNFSRAAERCHVSQPSLSQQIAKLELRLGQRLFDRLGRRVILTDAGRMLLERAEAILSAVDDAEQRLRGGEEWEGGQLAIGAIPTIAPFLLPRPLDRFARRHPAVEVTVHEDVTQNLLAASLAGELDLVILATPANDERLVSEPLLTEPLLLALPAGHRLARRRRITLADLSDERFIVLNEVHCLGQQVLAFCRVHDCQPRIACRSAQIATVQALIALGQGVSLLPSMAQRADRASARTYRSLAEGEPHRTITVVRHRHRFVTPAAERFLAELRRSLGREDRSNATDETRTKHG